VLRKHVVPALGYPPLQELSTNRIDAVLADLSTRRGNLQRKAKVVAGAMLDVAVGLGTVDVGQDHPGSMLSHALGLLTYSGFYDIPLRDFGPLVAALATTQLARVYDAPWHRVGARR
jgi:hypothetical protein